MRPEDKIYNAYFNSKKKTLYFNEIKELSKLSDSSLTNTLNKLIENKFLIKEKTKSNTFYKIKNKKIFALKCSEIASQKFENLNRGVKVPLRNFLKEMPQTIFTIVLFGSASERKEEKGSDIDILIVTDKKQKYDKIKNKVNALSNYPLSIFQCNIKQFITNKDHIIIQTRKKGIPIFKEQNFYEVILDEY